MGIFSSLKHKDKDKKDSPRSVGVAGKADKKEQPILDSKKEKKEELTIADIKEGKNPKSKTSKDNKSKFKTKANKYDTKNAYKVLMKALVTEKASYLKSENKYLFEVNLNTNKNEIKKAIYHVYGVWPTKVNISNLGGKNKRYGRNTGITKSRKKAIVTLKQGDSIELYEGV
jgi:large subunit ribosomal protein L23